MSCDVKPVLVGDLLVALSVKEDSIVRDRMLPSRNWEMTKLMRRITDLCVEVAQQDRPLPSVQVDLVLDFSISRLHD